MLCELLYLYQDLVSILRENSEKTPEDFFLNSVNRSNCLHYKAEGGPRNLPFGLWPGVEMTKALSFTTSFSNVV